jgi:hypothetical protein
MPYRRRLSRATINKWRKMVCDGLRKLPLFVAADNAAIQKIPLPCYGDSCRKVQSEKAAYGARAGTAPGFLHDTFPAGALSYG